jgi:hypothetical protein
MAIDWSKAPDGCTHYGEHEVLGVCGYFKLSDEKLYFWQDDLWKIYNCEKSIKQTNEFLALRGTVELGKQSGLSTSVDYLTACAQVQAERGKQYDAKGTGERSFQAAADAFNAVTGRDLKGSDVCLILEMVKLVRQYSSPDRLHDDSVLDKVSYSALWAEQITQELGA